MTSLPAHSIYQHPQHPLYMCGAERPLVVRGVQRHCRKKIHVFLKVKVLVVRLFTLISVTKYTLKFFVYVFLKIIAKFVLTHVSLDVSL